MRGCSNVTKDAAAIAKKDPPASVKIKVTINFNRMKETLLFYGPVAVVIRTVKNFGRENKVG